MTQIDELRRHRLTLPQAARILGTDEKQIRKTIERGLLEPTFVEVGRRRQRRLDGLDIVYLRLCPAFSPAVRREIYGSLKAWPANEPLRDQLTIKANGQQTVAIPVRRAVMETLTDLKGLRQLEDRIDAAAGTALIRGTGVEAHRIAALVAGGMPIDEVLRDYPGLQRAAGRCRGGLCQGASQTRASIPGSHREIGLAAGWRRSQKGVRGCAGHRVRDRYLLDRMVLQELEGPRGNTNVRAWLATVDDDVLYVSAITVMEARKGFARERKRASGPGEAEKIAAFEMQFDELLRAFDDRVLPVDRLIADRWGEMLAERNANILDTAVAATAAIHGMAVATRNLRESTPGSTASTLTTSFVRPVPGVEW